MEFIDLHTRTRDAIIKATGWDYGKMLFRQGSLPDNLLSGSFGLEWPRAQRLGMDGAQATRRRDSGRVRILIGLETDDQDEALKLASAHEAKLVATLQQAPGNPCSVEGAAVTVGSTERRVIGRFLELLVNIEAEWTETIPLPA